MTFFDTTNVEHRSTRLRALIHRLNTEFSTYMRDNGQKRKVIESRSEAGEESDESDESAMEDQILVTEREMKDWVKEVLYLFF